MKWKLSSSAIESLLEHHHQINWHFASYTLVILCATVDFYSWEFFRLGGETLNLFDGMILYCKHITDVTNWGFVLFDWTVAALPLYSTYPCTSPAVVHKLIQLLKTVYSDLPNPRAVLFSAGEKVLLFIMPGHWCTPKCFRTIIYPSMPPLQWSHKACFYLKVLEYLYLFEGTVSI